MRPFWLATALCTALLGCTSADRRSTDALLPCCALHLAEMPPTWRPTPAELARSSDRPWTRAEAADARRAVERGFDEMVAWLAAHPRETEALGNDAVEAVLDVSYAAGHMPELRRRAREVARRLLEPLVARLLAPGANAQDDADFATLLPLAVYAHQLFGHTDPRSIALVRRSNAALAASGSLAAALDCDPNAVLENPRAANDDVYDLVMWAISLTEAQVVPGLSLPFGSRALMPRLWRYLARYPLIGAREYAEGANDETFYDTAYLATHIGYIPTGYGRHALHVADAPWLYRFLRENFYPVLAMGELDLLAEFVDLLRQYGCDETNDRQVRDGSRYLLRVFHAAGQSFMAHRESYETGAVEPYDLIHKAWTGIAGLRTREVESPGPGTYGSVFRR
ncbi:MAG: hypothetical protein KDC87_21940, partial [Planctomycetes bacterium]|nr:hypothetical protein [Planctomycetota bacterium]